MIPEIITFSMSFYLFIYLFTYLLSSPFKTVSSNGPSYFYISFLLHYSRIPALQKHIAIVVLRINYTK